MENKKQEVSRYTTIIHKVRLSLGMTCNEYCVADIIFALSNNPDSKVSGWCFASRETIGEFIGINESTVRRIVEKLIEKKLVEKEESLKYLRTTSLWYQSVVLERLKMKNISTCKTPDQRAKRPTPTCKTPASEACKTPDNKNNRYKNNKEELSTNVDRGKPQSYGNNSINEILSYQKTLAKVLDGSVQHQRYSCNTFIKRVTNVIREETGGEPQKGEIVNACKKIIEIASQDKFHSKHISKIKYISDNIGAILNSNKFVGLREA